MKNLTVRCDRCDVVEGAKRGGLFSVRRPNPFAAGTSDSWTEVDLCASCEDDLKEFLAVKPGLVHDAKAAKDAGGAT